MGRDLFTDAPRWVPHAAVSADYTIRGPDAPFQATTNGLAAGNHLLEALCHGLCEVIERDAMALWRVLPERSQDATLLDLATAPARLQGSLLDRFRHAGVSLCAFDLTSDIGVPSVLCLAVDDDQSGEVQPQLGSGCHPDPAIALARAASEAAQARLTRISGARDDLAAESYVSAAARARTAAARDWLRSARARGPGRRLECLPDCATPTLRGDLTAVLGRLAGAGFDEAVWVDLSDPRFGIPVVRVVVPGLEGPPAAAGGGYVPGARARARLAAQA